MYEFIGPYFAIEEMDHTEEWQPLTTLLDGSGALHQRLVETQRRLAGDNGPLPSPRVAASVVHFGLVARLVSPAIAAALLDREIPSWSPENIYWKPVLGMAMPLCSTARTRTAASPTAFYDIVVAGVLDPLLATVAGNYAVSTRVLHGNVASAIHGASRLLGRARPELRAESFSRAVLSQGDLNGTLDSLGSRRSCCLYYRTPLGGYCQDCILRR